MLALNQFDPWAPYRGAQALLQRPPTPYPYGSRVRRRVRRVSPSAGAGLGALTPDQAVESVFPTAKVRSGAGHNQATRDLMTQAAAAGQLLNVSGQAAYLPGTADCSATGQSTNVRLAQTSAGLALTGTTIGLELSNVATAAALAPWTLGISAIIGLFPIIFGHHAAAVKKEQSVLCAAVPAANNYLQIIDQAVAQGSATPQQAIAALDSLVSDFRSQVSSIIHGSDPTSSGECNAACVMLSQLRAIVALKQSAYQDAIAAAPATAAGAIPGTAAVSSAIRSLPPWALWLIGGLVVYELL